MGSPHSTAALRAKEHGVSERTIERHAEFAPAVDTIASSAGLAGDPPALPPTSLISTSVRLGLSTFVLEHG
jgi:hypothetical protein